MARADHIKALIRRHAQGDEEGFYSVVLQLAAQAARAGQAQFAGDLKKLVDEARARRSAVAAAGGPVPIARPRGELVGLLDLVYPKGRLADLVLTGERHEALERIVLEQRERDRLRSHGLAPVRHVLLVGPPGTGKTYASAALAGELGLPLFTIRLDGLITKFMGETGAKLRLVFDAVAGTRGVYLFDEVDALAGERALGNDVGEIRRILNSFLQLLEQDTSDSLILAATNHPTLLDRAIFRRFDAVLRFELPDDAQAEALVLGRLHRFGASSLDLGVVVGAARGLSHAEIGRACDQAAKLAVLQGRERVDTAELLTALAERRRTREHLAQQDGGAA